MKQGLRSLMHRGNVGSTVKWDMFVINFFSGFQILQLGMMGTTVIYSSGDEGVAGTGSNTTQGFDICLNSKRMSWASWSAILLLLTFMYEDQEVDNGTVFNPSFPVRADLVSFIPNDALFYFSLRVRTWHLSEQPKWKQDLR
jgi:hypothetical protein